MQVFNLKNGPLPASASITTNVDGGTLRIFVVATAKLASYQPGNEYIIGVLVEIDGQAVGQATMWVDDDTTRHTIVNVFEVPSPSLGRHTIALTPFKQTPTTQWDTYSLVVEEYLAE